MKKLIIALAALTALVAGCAQEQVAGEAKADGLSGAAIEYGEASYFLGEPVVYENVAVVPLTTGKQDQQRTADYVTLAEATKNDWIEIIEKPGDGMVSELTVRYTGPRPLLLLAGELLLGGKQDRVVAEDFVIDPLSTVVVPVFCVERGRWSGSTLSFRSAGLQVPMSVKERVLMDGQNEVWASTWDYNVFAGTGSAGVSTVDAGLKSKEVLDFTASGRDEFKDLLKGDDSVVGVVFIIDGKIRSMEIFSSHHLLDSSFDSILGGILAEAAVSDGESTGLPTREELEAFLIRALDAQAAAVAGAGMAINGNVDLSGFSMGVSGASFYAGQTSESGIDGVTARPVHSSFINRED